MTLHAGRDGTPPPLQFDTPPAATPPGATPATRRARMAVTLWWVRYHAYELIAVTVPLVLAAVVSWWLAAATLLVVALWVRQEVASRRRGDPGE